MPQAPLTGQELRERFRHFFEAKGHRWVASDALVPREDPTVLFTSAGMNQFKEYFLGRRRDLTRAASCQKCLRIGDLDKIRELRGHHTFFEMLGNFSFGDYFKREAIEWAWEFVTGTLDYAGRKKSPLGPEVCLQLSPEALWVSVYTEDPEAFALWERHVGVPREKIRTFGAEENFWPANAPTEGPNGPCGPCSELYVRHRGHDVEVWNLVFTQFDRRDTGELATLPRPNIDTGMGLERLTQVVQQKTCDYETELFDPIVRAIRPMIRAKAVELAYVYAVADHLRAIVFAVSDGVMPSNESRGYVVRMLMRRAIRYGVTKLQVEPRQYPQGLLAQLAPAVCEALCGSESPYQEVRHHLAHLQTVLAQEEHAFLATLEEGTARAQELLQPLTRQRITVVPGELVFKLYDTFGLPSEVTAEIAQELKFQGIDQAGFQRLLAEQQARSRATSQFGGAVFTETYQTLLAREGGTTRFLGYEQLEAEGTVVALFHQQQRVTTAQAGEAVDVVLDHTPFYGESGGQVGDTGLLQGAHAKLDVTNTRTADQAIVHTAVVVSGRVQTGEVLRASVDSVRRLHIARNHTATHVLHSVLREQLGMHVQQRGSLVAPDRLRFDFTHPKALDEAALQQVELAVNRRIMQDEPRQVVELPFEEAKRQGALAFFGDKYGARVRVVTIGTYSKELCGGTHLERTGQVGPFKIISESSIAAGVRRMEAVTGEAATQLMRAEGQRLSRLAAKLSRPPEQLEAALDELLAKQRHLERTVHHLKRTASLDRVEELLAQRCEQRGIGFLVHSLGNIELELMRQLADQLRHQLQNTVILLAATDGADKVSLLLGATADLVRQGYDASQLIKPIAKLIGGSGGGRKDVAQAGGKLVTQLEATLAQAPQLILEQVRAT